MSRADRTGSIQFTREEEQLTVLDTRLTRTEDRPIKMTLYTKATHTDKYLNFTCCHSHHKRLGVVRTHMYTCVTITSQEADNKLERDHPCGVLRACGYPSWSLKMQWMHITTNRKKRKT